MTTVTLARPSKLHARLAVLILVIGVVLMARQMYEDDEPGAIPLLLIVIGVGWFAVTRARVRGAAKRLHTRSADQP